jgi:hypothetical protein
MGLPSFRLDIRWNVLGQQLPDLKPNNEADDTRQGTEKEGVSHPIWYKPFRDPSQAQE